MADYRSAIANIESGGNYGAQGPYTRGDRPYGKYQVMGANIGPWTQQALGRAFTAQEFLADPRAQDATFDKIFGGYVSKYGERGAAEAWFGGPGSVGKSGRKDVLGTSVGSYGDMFQQSLGRGGQQRGSDTPQTDVLSPPPINKGNPLGAMAFVPGFGDLTGSTQTQPGYQRPLPFEEGFGGQQFMQGIIGGTLKQDLRAAVFKRVLGLFI